jgi:hypothetical protein
MVAEGDMTRGQRCNKDCVQRAVSINNWRHCFMHVPDE